MGPARRGRSLTGGTLKPHVGHKVEVTGTMNPRDGEGHEEDTMAKPDADGWTSMARAMAGTLSVKYGQDGRGQLFVTE